MNSKKRHKKDFSWKKREKNPFAREETNAPWKKWGKLVIGIFLLSIVIGVGIYHPWFQVNKMSIHGLERVGYAEFESTVYNTMDYKRFFVIPGDNYFFVDVDEIRDILKNRYPLASISVQKHFPNTLNITVAEKISTIIYDNGKQYSLLDLDGKMVEIIRNVGEEEWVEMKDTVSTTDEFGQTFQEEVVTDRYHTPLIDAALVDLELPILYDSRKREGDTNEQILKPAIVEGVISWFELLRLQTPITLSYIQIDNSLGYATFYTKDGWYFKADITKAEEQIQILKFVLEEKVDRQALSYIDLRIEDQVYWK